MNQDQIDAMRMAEEALEFNARMCDPKGIVALAAIRVELEKVKPAPDGRIPKTSFTFEEVKKATDMAYESGYECAKIEYCPEIEHMAEEADCVALCLDRADIPRNASNGETYSLWGRVQLYSSKQIRKVVAFLDKNS